MYFASIVDITITSWSDDWQLAVDPPKVKISNLVVDFLASKLPP